MSFTASWGYGRLTSGQYDSVWLPRLPNNKPPVLIAHGYGQSGGMSVGASGTNVPNSWNGLATLCRNLCNLGFAVAAPSTGNTFGNTTARARLTDAATWLRSQGWASNDAAILVGVSMGFTAITQYAHHTGDVACLVGLIGCTDIDFVREGDTIAGVRAAIDAAWSVTYPAPLPVNSRPVDVGPGIDVPQALWSSSDDTITGPDTDYLAAVPSCTFTNIGALGHTNAAVTAAAAGATTFIQSIL